jgi:hypothetical protein
VKKKPPKKPVTGKRPNLLTVFEEIQQRLTPVTLVMQNGKPGTKESLPTKIEKEVVEPVSCSTFEELCTYYEKELHFSPAMRTTLACLLSTILATPLKGAQLWIRIIGRPGSGKSTLAEIISPYEHCYPRSVFKGLVTGGRPSETRIKATAEKLRGKIFIVKDADPLLQQPNRKQIESELRDAYDGVIRAEYRTGIEYEVKTSFSCVLCGTKELRDMDDAILGARFLDIEIDEGIRPDLILQRSMESTYQRLIAGMGRGSHNGDCTETDTVVDRLKPPTLGFLLHKSQEPDVELPTRICDQLTRLGVFLCVVLDKPKVDVTVLKILRKVALDTSKGFQLEATQALYRKEELTLDQIAAYLRLSETQTRRIVTDMRELKIVTNCRKASNIHGRGRKLHFFTLTDEVAGLAKKIRL